ncbi:MAG: rhodanese-like domain-containing protein [Flavobacteriaceae bacterium]
MKNVHQKEWKALLERDKNAVVIDCRTQREWEGGVQENAILMDVNQSLKFEKKVQALDKTKSYYVYCRSGQRSIKACRLLEAAGITNTYNLLGGMIEWKGKTVVPEI